MRPGRDCDIVFGASEIMRGVGDLNLHALDDCQARQRDARDSIPPIAQENEKPSGMAAIADVANSGSLIKKAFC